METPREDITVHLERLAENKDYFGLIAAYESHYKDLDPKSSLYWQAVYGNLTGREYSSTLAASRYLRLYGQTDSGSGEMLYILAIDRLRRFRYRAAASTLRQLLKYHSHEMDNEELEEARSNLAVCRALRNVPPQSVSLDGAHHIDTSTTSLGHITARVEAGGHSGGFMLDTGANFSTVGLSAARAMGLVPATGGGVEVGTSTGIRLECGLAHAPLLTLGGVTVRNAVFIVMDDSQLSFPEMDYHIEGIIGLPVLRALGNLTFSKGRVTIGRTRIPRNVAPNLCFEGLMPLVSIKDGDDKLVFTLDTGANQSEFSYGYYNARRETLDTTAREYNGLRGGGGGVVRQRTMMLRNQHLTVGGRDIDVPRINVIREDYEFSRGKDGNLGLDVLMSHGGFCLSFSRMTLYLFKKSR